jgi:selenide,water dikinase
VIVESTVNAAIEEVAFDPQTSGGLLIAVGEKVAGRLIRKLRANGVTVAAVVGRAVAKRDAWVYLR